MKAAEIKVGGHYVAKVSNKLTTVRVDTVREVFDHNDKSSNRYDVTNLATGRKTTFRSAMKFHFVALMADTPSPVVEEGEQGSDFTSKTPTQTRPDTSTTAKSPLAAALASQHKVETIAAPHLIVEARAGTGKTTTLIEGLKMMRGLPTSITPSVQQAAVWEQMALSRDAETVCFVAFNKSIASELQSRVPQGCDAMTMHSMGYRAVTKALGRQEPNSYVVQDIIGELLGQDVRDLRKSKPVVLRATEDLVGLCKMNLTASTSQEYNENSAQFMEAATASGGSPEWAEAANVTRNYWTETLSKIARHYDIDLNGAREEVFSLVPRVLDRCKTPKGKISFDDMVWLPVVLGLPVFQYDLLLVDEFQDTNRCQQALAKKAGKRLILVGDPRQAIYGFAGADAESMPRMERELNAGCPRDEYGVVTSPRKCVVLPLTVTRRCGKAIVAEAQRIVPDFTAHESNGEGSVGRAQYPVDKDRRPRTGNDIYTGYVQDGDMVLCRCNAPLVTECFRFLKAGRKAQIQGRDIGAGLISTVKKLTKDDPTTPVRDLMFALSNWVHAEVAKEQAKRDPNETKIQSMQDRYDCLICFCDSAFTAGDVIRKIETVFTDDKKSPGIKLSSIHKSKGLEARRVFILQLDKACVPAPWAKRAWEREQEQNLHYVAITRAIEELVYVS